MQINYERVAQLLADEAFKMVVKGFFADDLHELIKGKKGRPGLVVCYVTTAICTEMDFPAEKIEPCFSHEEMTEFMLKHKDYISDIIKRVVSP
jgi:hypothetical protein